MTPHFTPLSYFDIVDACAQPGCPLCRLSAGVVQRYPDTIVYEYVNDPALHDQLSRSLGYCNEHAWRLPDVSGGAALGVAIVYRDQMKQLALTALVQALSRADPQMQSSLQSSAGLCLVHLRRALALAPNAAAFNFVRDVTDVQLARLVGELTEYIRKCDYRFSAEVFGPEADSWRRALAAVAGARGLR